MKLFIATLILLLVYAGVVAMALFLGEIGRNVFDDKENKDE